MATLAEIRAKYPQYADMSDQQIAEGLHKKFYSDLPFGAFAKKIGYKRPVQMFDATEHGVVPSESIAYTPSGTVPASSGIAERQRKYGVNTGFDFSIKPENLRDTRMAINPILRGGVKAVTALPGLAADAGVGLRNTVTGENTEAPTSMMERSLNQYLPMPNTPGDKTLEFMTSVLGGAKLPAPTINNPAPANFVKPNFDLVRQQTLKDAQSAGYVVPPSTTNPTAGNTFLESFGGKIATAQDAALKNQEITNTLAKKTLGLSEDAPLTQEALSSIRREAGKAYEQLRGVQHVPLDDAATKTLDDLATKFTGNKLKEALGGGNDIPKIIQAIKSEPLTGDTAVDAIAMLRDKAGTAYAQGSKELGKAYKTIASEIEGLMENSLSGDALKNFREARQLIAKTYSVESAFNQSTGNVNAARLGSQLARNKPLSGELRTAARFGQAFPRAAKEVVDSGAVRNTDAILASGASVFTGHPWYLGWPFLRQGARSYLLSNAGQANALPKATGGLPPEMAMGLLNAAEQARLSGK